MGKTKEAKKHSVALTILGSLIIIWSFITMYKYERVDNEEWETKKAKNINPAKFNKKTGMVKFTGIAEDGLITDELSNKKFSYLNTRSFQFKKIAKKKTERIKKDGRTEYIKKTYFKNEWIYKNSKTEKATILKIGSINVRFKEAKLMGEHEWNETYYFDKENANNPKLGDKKYILSGIPAETPLFCVGHLSNNFLSKGNLFLISTYSEGQTIEELSETHWILGPFCFILLLLGFLLLANPLIVFSREKKDIPVFKFIAKIGYPVYFILTFFIAFFIVRYSDISVNLVWIFIAGLFAYLGLLLYKKLASN